MFTYLQSWKPDWWADSGQDDVARYLSQNIPNRIGGRHIVELVTKHTEVLFPATSQLESIISKQGDTTYIPDTKALTTLAASRNLIKNPIITMSYVQQKPKGGKMEVHNGGGVRGYIPKQPKVSSAKSSLRIKYRSSGDLSKLSQMKLRQSFFAGCCCTVG